MFETALLLFVLGLILYLDHPISLLLFMLFMFTVQCKGMSDYTPKDYVRLHDDDFVPWGSKNGYRKKKLWTYDCQQYRKFLVVDNRKLFDCLAAQYSDNYTQLRNILFKSYTGVNLWEELPSHFSIPEENIGWAKLEILDKVNLWEWKH